VTRVLVVDDEPQILRSLGTTLSANGYDVIAAETGEGALAMAAAEEPDLVILDLGLPDIDGAEVIRRLRAWSQVPVIVLSVRDRQDDKIGALDAGADDYVTKPFGLGELLARIRAAQRRAGRDRAEPVLRFADVTVDLARTRVTAAGEAVHLTPTEYRLLEAMVTNPGKLLTQRWLLQRVWGGTYGDEANYLRVFVRQLRQKLGDHADAPRFILTEPGIGYRWLPDPDPDSDPDPDPDADPPERGSTDAT
jgi:two-component system KDP operon response regulator KdpE